MGIAYARIGVLVVVNVSLGVPHVEVNTYFGLGIVDQNQFPEKF